MERHETPLRLHHFFVALTQFFGLVGDTTCTPRCEDATCDFALFWPEGESGTWHRTCPGSDYGSESAAATEASQSGIMRFYEVLTGVLWVSFEDFMDSFPPCWTVDTRKFVDQFSVRRNVLFVQCDGESRNSRTLRGTSRTTEFAFSLFSKRTHLCPKIWPFPRTITIHEAGYFASVQLFHAGCNLGASGFVCPAEETRLLEEAWYSNLKVEYQVMSNVNNLHLMTQNDINLICQGWKGSSERALRRETPTPKLLWLN